MRYLWHESHSSIRSFGIAPLSGPGPGPSVAVTCCAARGPGPEPGTRPRLSHHNTDLFNTNERWLAVTVRIPGPSRWRGPRRNLGSAVHCHSQRNPARRAAGNMMVRAGLMLACCCQGQDMLSRCPESHSRRPVEAAESESPPTLLGDDSATRAH